MENNSSVPQPRISDQEMIDIIHSRENIFTLAQESRRYLSEPLPPDQLSTRVKNYLVNLKASAEASILECMLSDKYPQFPVALCTGADADWLWFSDRVAKAYRLPPEQAVQIILDACLDLLINCRPGTPCDPGMAEDVMHDLQSRFGFLTNCFGVDGCFSIVYPSFSAFFNSVDINFGATIFGSPKSRFVMCASPNNSTPENMIRFLYLAVATAIVEYGEKDALNEENLSLLEQTVDPNIRVADPDSQVPAYVSGLMLGLSYGGRHIDFDVCPSCSAADRHAWRDYVAAEIKRIGEKRIAV